MGSIDLGKLKNKRKINHLESYVEEEYVEEPPIQNQPRNIPGSNPLPFEKEVPHYHLSVNENELKRDVRVNWKVSRRNKTFIDSLRLAKGDQVKFITSLIELCEERPDILREVKIKMVQK